MVKLEDMVWHEKCVNNIDENPLEEYYCLIDVGEGCVRKYSIKPQYPLEDDSLIIENHSKEPELYILFESRCHYASEKEKKLWYYSFNCVKGCIEDDVVFIRAFKDIEDAKKRAFFQYRAIYGYAFSYVTDSVDEATKEHKVI